MNFDVVYTDHFDRELKQLAKKHRSIKADLESLIDELEVNPAIGTPIGKDCF